MNKYITIGAFFGILAVVIGAFGAHGLENMLSTNALERYHTGVEYQFYHVGALLIIGILFNQDNKRHSRLLKFAGIAFTLGIILFSGSLYLYALTGIAKLGMITPFGGLAFIIGWFLLFLIGIKK